MKNKSLNEFYILIPACECGNVIGPLIERIKKYTDKILVVDDGSCDETALNSERAGAEVIRHHRNVGKGGALRSGMEYLLRRCGQGIITMDADGQHDPDDLPKFLRAYSASNADMIIGVRFTDGVEYPRYRYITNMIGTKIMNAYLDLHLADSQSGYRLYKREALKEIKIRTSGFETETEILMKMVRRKRKVLQIPVRTIYERKNSETSHYKPVTDTYEISLYVWKDMIKSLFRLKKRFD